MIGKKFATAINCIDGRVQFPVLEWLLNDTHADYIDMITEPGPDHALINGSPEAIEAIKRKILISVENHQSGFIAIAGHYDCAANEATREEHCQQIKQCVELVSGWFSAVPVVGLYVNEEWKVEVVCSKVVENVA